MGLTNKIRIYAGAAAPFFVVSCSVLGNNEHKNTFEIRRDTAVSSYDQGDMTMAVNRARKALELEPNDATALSILGMSLVRSASSTQDARTSLPALNEAITTFQRAEDHGAADDWRVQFGHGTARVGRARLCLSLVEEGNKRLELLNKEATKPGSLLSAEEVANKRKRLNDEIELYKKTAAEDLPIATNRLEESLKKPNYSNYLAAHEHLQSAYALHNDPAGSIRYGNNVVEIIQNEREARNRALLAGRVDADTAARYRSELKRFDASDVNCRSLLALMYQRSGDDRKALAELNRLIVLDGSRPDEYYNRGACRQKLGEYAEAIRDYEMFIKKSTLPADSPIVRETWDRIDECKKKM